MVVEHMPEHATQLQHVQSILHLHAITKGTSRQWRELHVVFIVVSVMSKAKSVLFALDTLGSGLTSDTNA